MSGVKGNKIEPTTLLLTCGNFPYERLPLLDGESVDEGILENISCLSLGKIYKPPMLKRIVWEFKRKASDATGVRHRESRVWFICSDQNPVLLAEIVREASAK
jgi:hypothetical protein